VSRVARELAFPAVSPIQLLAQLRSCSHVAFDLDGTLYDARDFERPALDALVNWLRQRSGEPLEGLEAMLHTRRELDRHGPGLFDEALRRWGLPPSWGAECAERFRAYPGTELNSAPSLRGELLDLRSRGSQLALVTNGREELQQRKVRLLGLEALFDTIVYCDPRHAAHLKPTPWAWQQLRPWHGGAAVSYVGDDPVDAQFALAGTAKFIGFAFRNPRYED
jgi:FMN phosphatase YigB (HAD superfamily)